MSGYENDPEFIEWRNRVQADLVPKLEDSAMTISLVPEGETDIKFAVELGLSIMMDKPIIAVFRPGTKIPERLARVADEIVEADFSDMQDTQRRIMAATKRIAGG